MYSRSISRFPMIDSHVAMASREVPSSPTMSRRVSADTLLGSASAEESVATATPLQPLTFLDPAEVRELAREHGTPLYVYDERSMTDRFRELSDVSFPFGHIVRYSLKANCSAAVIRTFDRLGAHFDASSSWEAERAVRAGVAPEKILLTAQLLDAHAFSLAERGMKISACSLNQLEQVGIRFPGSRVSIRINPGRGSGLNPKLTSGGPSASFGIWHEYLDSARDIAARHRLRVERLHQHIGSSHGMEAWMELAENLVGIAESFSDVEVLDLGGGYTMHGFAHREEVDHPKYFERFAKLLRAHSDAGGKGYRIELEPGTYLMATSGSLICGIGDIVDTGPSGHRFLKLDAGVTEIVRPALYGALHPLVIVPLEARTTTTTEPFLVVGHCCIGGDQLTYKQGCTDNFEPIRLPTPTVGDYLVIERAGGYCASMSMKNFNSFPEAAEVLREHSGRTRLIRTRQTLDQLIANECPNRGEAR